MELQEKDPIIIPKEILSNNKAIIAYCKLSGFGNSRIVLITSDRGIVADKLSDTSTWMDLKNIFDTDLLNTKITLHISKDAKKKIEKILHD